MRSLFPFAVANRDVHAFEIDVFDAESAAFHEAHPGALHRTAESLHDARRKLVEDSADFVDAEDDGEPLGLFRSNGVDLVVVHFGRVDPAPGSVAMEANETLHSAEIGGLGANRHVSGAVESPGLFEQGRLERPRGVGFSHNQLSGTTIARLRPIAT